MKLNSATYYILIQLIVAYSSLEVKKSTEINNSKIDIALLEGRNIKHDEFVNKVHELKGHINMRLHTDPSLPDMSGKLDSLLIKQNSYYVRRAKKPNKYALIGGAVGVSLWGGYFIIDKSEGYHKALIFLAGPLAFGYGALIGAITGETTKGVEVEEDKINKINNHITFINQSF